jgi:group I intron endonuclease
MTKGIYKIINVVNNKFYVGSAVDLKRRKTRHFSELRTGKHNNKHLQAAWNKYGESSFIFVVVEEVSDPINILDVENIWLKEHVGKEYCYNIGVDAVAPMLGMSGILSPTFGRKRTQEELLAQNWTGRKHSEESKGKIRAWLINKPKSAETRAKISASLMGDKNFNYGKPRSDEFKEKVSKRVQMTRENTTTEYASIVELREATGLKPATVNRALKSGKPISKGPFTGCVIQYLK